MSNISRRRSISASIALCLLLSVSTPAAAINILLTNDDGFETENIQALYRVLVSAGHSVILSAPYLGQSGSGGRIEVLRALQATDTPSEGELLPAGSPPLGPTTIAPQQFYVDSAPTVAAAYGIDVLAPRIWGAAPDLVLSGPNEGNNLGVITPHSGTLGAAVLALNKQIPAIAVSAATADPEHARLVAEGVLRLITMLAKKPRFGLPPGTGLNVNFPEWETVPAGADDLSFAYTRIGASANIGLQFFENLGESKVANSFGVPANVDAPGLSIALEPMNAGYPVDEDKRSETNRLATGAVTVSPIQGTYAADERRAKRIGRALRKLLRE